MDSWIPLLGAVIAGASAIGVAIWNSRGESADLRKLRAMNEALEGLGESPMRDAMQHARDLFAMRIVLRISASSPWRGFWSSVLAVAAAGTATMALLYVASSWGSNPGSWDLAGFVVIASGATAMLLLLLYVQAARVVFLSRHNRKYVARYRAKIDDMVQETEWADGRPRT